MYLPRIDRSGFRTGRLTETPIAPYRLIATGAATLSLSVMADSAIEHYRGSFRRSPMTAPVFGGAAALVRNALRAAGLMKKWGSLGDRTAMLTGMAGLCFHAWNIAKRPGSPRLNGFFYGAPIGAPAALTLAGALGAAARNLAIDDGKDRGYLSDPRAIGAIASLGMVGSAGEAALLHFRGAYHNPAMWAPIALPPAAAIALARDVSTGRAHRGSAGLLSATALLGLAGTAFHVLGVARHMGGWSNWRQNLLAGPPVPAPPAFTGLALAGLGALLAMRGRPHG